MSGFGTASSSVFGVSAGSTRALTEDCLVSRPFAKNIADTNPIPRIPAAIIGVPGIDARFRLLVVFERANGFLYFRIGGPRCPNRWRQRSYNGLYRRLLCHHGLESNQNNPAISAEITSKIVFDSKYAGRGAQKLLAGNSVPLVTRCSRSTARKRGDHIPVDHRSRFGAGGRRSEGYRRIGRIVNVDEADEARCTEYHSE